MRLIVSVLGCTCFLFAGAARAATLHVPADYSTIYEALDAAANGDVVEVAPGTYDQFDTRPLWAGDNVSSVGFLRDGVTLRSSGGAAATTLRMDASAARPAVLFGGAGEFHVGGFTLTGSLADLTAVSIQSPDDATGTGSLALQDCVIRDFGMGDPVTHELAIDAYNANVHIQDCSIENLDSPNAVAVHFNGGQHLFEDSSIKNCPGGGIRMVPLFLGDETLTVKRSSFENNGGRGISANVLNLTVEDSWFFQNTGGGVGFSSSESGGVLIVRNNTFGENSGSGPGRAISSNANLGEFIGNTFYGGDQALFVFGGGGSSMVLERNVVSFTTERPAVEVFEVEVQSGCNVFWQNAGGNTAGFFLGATDLVSDPQFCNASAQDFTVNAASPCLPWNNNGCGQIGAWGLGCGDVSVEPSSWGQIKALYR